MPKLKFVLSLLLRGIWAFQEKKSFLLIIRSVFSVEKVNFYKGVEALSVFSFFPNFYSTQGFSVTAQADIVLVPVNTYNHSCL